MKYIAIVHLYGDFEDDLDVDVDLDSTNTLTMVFHAESEKEALSRCHNFWLSCSGDLPSVSHAGEARLYRVGGELDVPMDAWIDAHSKKYIQGALEDELRAHKRAVREINDKIKKLRK